MLLCLVEVIGQVLPASSHPKSTELLSRDKRLMGGGNVPQLLGVVIQMRRKVDFQAEIGEPKMSTPGFHPTWSRYLEHNLDA